MTAVSAARNTTTIDPRRCSVISECSNTWQDCCRNNQPQISRREKGILIYLLQHLAGGERRGGGGVKWFNYGSVINAYNCCNLSKNMINRIFFAAGYTFN